MSDEHIPPMRVDEEVAKAAGVSRDTVRKVETVLAKADEPIKAAMLAGEKSIKKIGQQKRPVDQPTGREVQFIGQPLSSDHPGLDNYFAFNEVRGPVVEHDCVVSGHVSTQQASFASILDEFEGVGFHRQFRGD